jgi:hypothetical protein
MDMSTEMRESTDSNIGIGPRLVIILHPNTSCIDIALNDRLFNREKYTHSRDTEPVGAEKELLDTLQGEIIGVSRAQAGKNTLRLDLDDGVLLREFMPQVVDAVIRWGSASAPYAPEIYVENRRYEEDPEYDRFGDQIRRGIRQEPQQADIGLPYKVWKSGR